MWGGTPNRPPTSWVPEYPVGSPWETGPGRWETERPAAHWWGPEHLAEPDRADATDGRHALDRDAALTPIFTALRRGRWQRPRGPAGAPGLRLAPAPVERYHGGPPTSPIPVVPALHALDPYPTGGYGAASVDPYASGGFPGVEPSASGGHHASGDLHARGSYRAVDPLVPGATRRASGELGRPQGRGASVDPFDPGSFAPRADPAEPPPSRTETTAVWSPADYSDYSDNLQVTDTGRHHRRLAPAGW
jgi:hypothetical protein